MKKQSPLVIASFEGDLITVKKYVEDGYDINVMDSNWSPLHAAIENDEVECIKYLIEAGADINQTIQNMTPLEHAVDISIDGTIQSGGLPGDEPTETIEILLNLNADAGSALEYANHYNCKKIVRLLNKNYDTHE